MRSHLPNLSFKRCILTALLLIAFALCLTAGEKAASELSHNNLEYSKKELIIQFNPNFIVDASVFQDSHKFYHRQMDSLNLVLQLQDIIPLEFSSTSNKTETNSTPLSNTFLFKFQNSIHIEKAIKQYSKIKEINFAEPNYYYFADGSATSGPSPSDQVHLDEAHQFIKKGRSVIIGIIDTGINWQNENLARYVWKNPHEELNGKDDDLNGLVDDIDGWNFADSNLTDDFDIRLETKPTDVSNHGTTVLKTIHQICHSHSSHLERFNFNKFLTIKAGFQTDNDDVIFSTVSTSRSLIYAIQQGAEVINLSWGGENYSRLLEETIAYASDNGCVIIASAGNKDNDVPHYPAAYKHVLAVSSVDKNDLKSASSNFGEWVDIAAPEQIPPVSSKSDSIYTDFTGTSIAAAHVTGLAALILSAENIDESDSVKHRVIWSSDNIYERNDEYVGKLGAGRLNVLRAVNGECRPNIIFQELSFMTQNSDDRFKPGDVVNAVLSIKNMSFTAENLNIRLESKDPYISLLQAEFSLPLLNYQEEADNSTKPFMMFIHPDYPLSRNGEITAELKTDNFSLTQTFTLPTKFIRPENLKLICQSPTIIEWDSSSFFRGYNIYRKNPSDKQFNRLNDSPIENSKYTIKLHNFIEAQEFYITGLDSSGWESPSSDTLFIECSSNIEVNFSPEQDTVIQKNDSLQLKISWKDDAVDSLKIKWIINDRIDSLSNYASYIYHPSKDSVDTAKISVEIDLNDSLIVHTWHILIIESDTSRKECLFFPANDTTLFNGDSLKVGVIHSDSTAKFQWLINGMIDTLSNSSYYDFIAKSQKSHVDTINLNLQFGDSLIQHQWLITTLNRNWAPEILHTTQPFDTTIAYSDSIMLAVSAIDADHDSLKFSWLINNQLDSTQQDSFFTFHKLDSSLVDTVTVQIADKDTLIQQSWAIRLLRYKNSPPEIVSASPSLDSTVVKADSIIFEIHCKDQDGDSLKFSWLKNNDVDSSAFDSTYTYYPIDKYSGIDTLKLAIADSDTIIVASWIIQPAEKDSSEIWNLPFSYYPFQDSLTVTADSVLFSINPIHHYFDIEWFINGKSDRDNTDTTFVYFPLQDSIKVDTVLVKISDQDTSYSHRWLLYPAESEHFSNEKIFTFEFFPNVDSLIMPNTDSLKLSLKLLTGSIDDISIRWFINQIQDSTANDSIYFFSAIQQSKQTDTIDVQINLQDSTIIHRWIVQTIRQQNIPGPKLIYPINGESITESTFFLWEKDSTLTASDSLKNLKFLIELSNDSSFMQIISSDSCYTTEMSLEKTSGFSKLAIGKSFYWRIKTIVNQYRSSDFKKCTLPFIYYPEFSIINNFYGEQNEEKHISLYWESGYSLNTAGYNILRGESENGTFEKINNYLITGNGNFSYQDKSVQAGKTYFYKLEDLSIYGKAKIHQLISVDVPLPKNYLLTQNFPNPFNSKTSFKYEIPANARVVIEIYNVLGRKVKTLLDEQKEPGSYTIFWDGIDDKGESVVSGIYFYHISANHFHMTHKMIVVR